MGMLYFSRSKTIIIWSVLFLGIMFSLPNILPSSVLNRLPSFFPKQSMTPGLDLQGGAHILLEIEKRDLIRERLESVRDEIRILLRKERIEYNNLITADRYAQLRIVNPEKIEQAKKLLSAISFPISTGFSTTGITQEFIFEQFPEGVLRYTLSDAVVDYHIGRAVSRSIAVISRRINEFGTTEPTIQQQGKDRILVQVPGLEDPQRLKDVLGRTAKLTFQMVDHSVSLEDALKGVRTPGTSILYSRDDPPVPYVIQNRIALSGENLVDAQPGFDSLTNEPIVTFRLDTKGALRFSELSRQNVGRAFAIILDNEVISAPRIREPILGGSGQISGNFTIESARDLSVLLKAGALPANLKIIEERTVGPSLGADSVSSGKIAAIISCILVGFFMCVAYSTFGVIANLALLVNLILIVASLSILGATLTMPGIAGIVLTIGMAVDSNVIIYERVREEQASGKILINSLDSGFSRAMATIFDANFTTFIAAAILFFLGSGPVKGFAVTLAIGIVTTVFTTFTLTRWMISFWLRFFNPKQFPLPVLGFIPENVPSIPFMRWRHYAFSFSAILSILSVLFFLCGEMNYGIDFRGGALIEIQAKNGNADSAFVRNHLRELNIGDVQVQKFGSDKELLLRVEAQKLGDSAEQSVVEKIRFVLGDSYDFRRVESVGPTVSSELAMYGTLGLLASLFAIFIYIWFRFEWQFSTGAIIATVHDVIMVIGLYVLFGFEFNLTSIAAILTIVGYSINDTVVVYDRVRENLRKYKKMPIDKLIDISINQTLSRTILTGLTTLLALIALYLFGGEVIRSFTFAMIFGILVGTWSSVFVAGPLLVLFRLRTENEEKIIPSTSKKNAHSSI